MATTQLATRIDKRVKDTLEKVCKRMGLKMSHFIEEALLDKLEELEDLEDLKNLREEPSRPISDIIKDLRAHGKL